MTRSAQTTPSPNIKDLTHDQFLRRVIAAMTPRLFSSRHLNPDWKIGFIGEPGDCKTISAVKQVFMDSIARGIPCFSNMDIVINVSVPDDNFLCLKYGIPGGSVEYRSRRIDKVALFHFDEIYRRSNIFIDEINVDMAEARRSSSNLNLNTNMVGQELRHLEAALTYTCISEMWVDNRIRDLTDIFIRCEDTALDLHGLLMKQTPGVKARWVITPMTRKLCGVSYQKSHQVIGPLTVRVRDAWDWFDTHEIQKKGGLKYGEELNKPETDWDWLLPIASEMLKDSREAIPAEGIYKHPEVVSRGIDKRNLTRMLKEIIPGLYTKHIYLENGRRVTGYVMPDPEVVTTS